MSKHGVERAASPGLIDVSHLSKWYGETQAVDDLSFTVQPGVVTGFLGPNGAGKSTTMRLMLELDQGEGETTFDGTTYSDLENPLTTVGALLETGKYHPARTAIGHLKMLAASSDISPTRAKVVLHEVGLTRVAHDHPRSFSLGMAQRFGLACALLGDPGILLLDEPANGLDPQGMTWLRGFLKDLAAEGRTVLVSSHLLQDMQLMADAVIVVGRGRLIAQGDLDDFVVSVTAGEVRVRTPMIDRLARVLSSAGGIISAMGEVTGAAITPAHEDGDLVVAGLTQETVGDLAFESHIPIHGLHTIMPSLEEAFLHVTEQAQEFQGTQRDAPGSGA